MTERSLLMNPIIKNNSYHVLLFILLLLSCFEVNASVAQGGSVKLTALGYALKDRDTPGVMQTDGITGLSGRYYLETHGEKGFDFQIHYQLSSQYQTSGALASLGNLLGGGTVNDQTRLMNLTDVISQSSNYSLVQRIDRLNIGYSGHKIVWRIGRQALGWGNGFTFQVMDFFNPTPPGSLDSDYKVGDDMFYMQWLTEKGNDWQFVYVLRRDLVTGNVEADELSLAWKFHWSSSGGDYDLLLAQHYGQAMIGMAMAKNVGAIILRTDFLQHDINNPDDWLYLLNTDYSRTCFSRNCHFFIEYFHNESAQRNIDVATLPANISQRLLRGEIYVMGRDYLGLGLTIEMSALSIMNSSLMYNLNDHSSFLISSYVYDFKQNWQFQAGLMLSFGRANSEFGGLLDTVTPDYQPTANIIFAQFSHYF